THVHYRDQVDDRATPLSGTQLSPLAVAPAVNSLSRVRQEEHGEDSSLMRTSRFAAKVVIGAASLALLSAAPATAASPGAQATPSIAPAGTGYHSTYNSKFACQWQA